MRAAVIGGAAGVSPQEKEFNRLAAQYEAIAKSLPQDQPPPPEAMIVLTFIRVQMVDLKIDMLAIGLKMANDPAARIVVPGRVGH